MDTAPLTLFSRASRPMGLASLAFDGTRYWLTVDATGPSSFDDTGVAIRLDTAATLAFLVAGEGDVVTSLRQA